MVITILRFASHITWNASDPRSVTLKMIYGITCDLSPTCPLSCDWVFAWISKKPATVSVYCRRKSRSKVMQLERYLLIKLCEYLLILYSAIDDVLVLDWMTCVLLWTPHAADSWLVLSFDVNMTINLISVSWTLFYQSMCGRTPKNVCVHNF